MTFSVIIPTYNRDQDLDECLESLKKNSIYKNEIIVLYNLNEKTKAICDKYGVKSVFDNARKDGKRVKGLWAILNEGIKAASNDCVMYLNDDCLVLPEWDKIAEQYFEKNRNLGLLVLKTKGIGQDPEFKVIKSLFGFPCANYAILNKKSGIYFDEQFDWFWGDADYPLEFAKNSTMDIDETSENMIIHNHKVDENRKINEDDAATLAAQKVFNDKWINYRRKGNRLVRESFIKIVYRAIKRVFSK